MGTVVCGTRIRSLADGQMLNNVGYFMRGLQPTHLPFLLLAHLTYLPVMLPH